jgi:endonuclease YncB( thermonuclease family)
MPRIPIHAPSLVLFFAFLMLFAAGECLADALILEPESEAFGVVSRVIDGDSLELAISGSQLKIRLAEIDAPERDQPYGSEATAALEKLVQGRGVRIEVVAIDRYGRTVARVYRGRLDVNAEMVRRGNAWAYTRYAETVEIINAEDEARAGRRGLWKLPPTDREAPWTWREKRRRGQGRAKGAEAPGASPDSASSSSFRCGSKRKCGEMSSCAEARFHLTQCSLSRIDGDRDGIPCESLCRGSR